MLSKQRNTNSLAENRKKQLAISEEYYSLSELEYLDREMRRIGRGGGLFPFDLRT